MWLKMTGDSGELNRIIEALQVSQNYFSTSAAMVPAVRAAGAGWYDNFKKEGARVGGWKPLKDYTIKERLARGYKAGPKLYQSGGLEKGAIRPFTNWPENQSRFQTAIPPTPMLRGRGYDDADLFTSGLTGVSGIVNPRRFTAVVNGAKALNQTGGNMKSVSRVGGWTRIPARPFWFFDIAMVDAAAAGIVNRFQFYAFRYLPKVTGVGQTWNRASIVPGRPAAAAGPRADPFMSGQGATLWKR